jgi:hypothetical protein
MKSHMLTLVTLRCPASAAVNAALLEDKGETGLLILSQVKLLEAELTATKTPQTLSLGVFFLLML